MNERQLRIDSRTASTLAELFRMLSDPSRIRIIAALVISEQNVRSIARAVDLSESATSHHLRNLRQMQLVRAEKKGREVYYRLDDEHVEKLFMMGLEHVLHD